MDECMKIKKSLYKFKKVIDLLPIRDPKEDKMKRKLEELIYFMDKDIIIKHILKMNYDQMDSYNYIIKNSLK